MVVVMIISQNSMQNDGGLIQAKNNSQIYPDKNHGIYGGNTRFNCTIK
jgi:dipeptidyl-peptidase-4